MHPQPHTQVIVLCTVTAPTDYRQNTMAMRHGGGRGGHRAAPYESSAGSPDESTVFVGNLPFDVDWKALKDHLTEAGEVIHANVKTGADGRSRGFGIVKFASAEDALNAVDRMHDSELGGRQIVVRLDNGGKGGGDGGGRGKGFGGKGDRFGKGGGKGKGKGGGGKGKGGGRPRSKDDLDSELDSYWTGKGAPDATREKKVAADKGSLDDDLDSYFASRE